MPAYSALARGTHYSLLVPSVHVTAVLDRYAYLRTVGKYMLPVPGSP